MRSGITLEIHVEKSQVCNELLHHTEGISQNKQRKAHLQNMYQRRLLLTSSLLMVLYTEISELFCTSFRLAFGQ